MIIGSQKFLAQGQNQRLVINGIIREDRINISA